MLSGINRWWKKTAKIECPRGGVPAPGAAISIPDALSATPRKALGDGGWTLRKCSFALSLQGEGLFTKAGDLRVKLEAA
jgi:hypothetical protein